MKSAEKTSTARIGDSDIEIDLDRVLWDQDYRRWVIDALAGRAVGDPPKANGVFVRRNPLRDDAA
jgi:hypothetical protein